MKRSKNPKLKIKNPSIVIVMGAPGAGKGTQAELLAEKLNLYYIETAKVGEAGIKKAKSGECIEVEGEKFYFDEQRKLWETGKLWAGPFITYLMQEKIRELYERGEGIIFAGSPRTLYEGEKIIPLLKKLYGRKNIKVILIEVTAKESIWRNSHRRICELMRHPVLYNKETIKLKRCPLDGSKLIKRKLDKPKIIKVRLKEYKEKTFPLLDIFKKEGLEIKKINGSPPPAEVFKAILKVLGMK